MSSKRRGGIENPQTKVRWLRDEENSTDPRWVAAKTKQAKACYLKTQPALAGFVSNSPRLRIGSNLGTSA